MQGMPLPILGEGEDLFLEGLCPSSTPNHCSREGLMPLLNTWLGQVTWEGEDNFFKEVAPVELRHY